MNIEGIAFLYSIFVSIVSVFIYLFAYMIYISTKGGSKGWFYIGVSAISICLWVAIRMVFTLFLPVQMSLLISGSVLFLITVATIVLFSIIAVTIPLAVLTLIRDMKIKTPPWLNGKVVLAYFLLVLVLLLLYNFLTPFIDIMAELLSISLLISALYSIVAIIGSYFIWKGTGDYRWIIMLLGFLFIFVGVFLASYAGNCCGDPANRPDLCSTYWYNYVQSTPIPCFEFLIPLASFGPTYTFIGLIFVCMSLYLIWKSMSVV